MQHQHIFGGVALRVKWWYIDNDEFFKLGRIRGSEDPGDHTVPIVATEDKRFVTEMIYERANVFNEIAQAILFNV